MVDEIKPVIPGIPDTVKPVIPSTSVPPQGHKHTGKLRRRTSPASENADPQTEGYTLEEVTQENAALLLLQPLMNNPEADKAPGFQTLKSALQKKRDGELSLTDPEEMALACVSDVLALLGKPDTPGKLLRDTLQFREIVSSNGKPKLPLRG